jgi:hypothetical protein
MSELIQAALTARRNGVSIVPVELPAKTPPYGFPWKDRQTRLPDETTIRRDLADRNGSSGFAIIGGAVSGNLEILDFDLEGAAYSSWVSLVEAEAPGLINRLSIQQTQSGGFHVNSRCKEATIPGSQKLASKRIEVDGPGQHEHKGKKYKAEQHSGQWFIYPTLIETKGEGGYAVAAPSRGYNVIQTPETGDFFDFPEISAAEREALIRCAKALDEKPPENVIDGPKQTTANANGLRPGEDFNQRGDVLEVLLKAGWKKAGGNSEKQQLTRPGKERGISGTLYKNGAFRNFSANAPPFDEDKNYSPFAIYALLEHGGDFTAAARELGRQGYGEQKEETTSNDVEKSQPVETVTKTSACTADKLMDMAFAATCWTVIDLLPSGYHLLVGKPKMGKSLLALNIAIAVSAPNKTLGHFEVEGGAVLYLGLEDTLRRLQTRLKQMFKFDGEPSPRLHFFTEWPRMDKGGLELLDQEITKHPGIRLVVIDTLAKFKPPRPAGVDPYEHDYMVGAALKQLADRHGITILVVHHMRKAKSEDHFDSVSGTFGVTGAADGTYLLIRKMGQADAELHVTGRDIESEEYGLKFNEPTLSWNVMGKLDEIKSTENKQKLYEAIKEYGAEFSPKQIASASGLSESYVKRMLPYLYREGNVKKLKRGRYEYAS